MAGIERRLRVRPERARVGRGEASGAVVRGGTSYRARGNRVDMGGDLETFNCTLAYSSCTDTASMSDWLVIVRATDNSGFARF